MNSNKDQSALTADLKANVEFISNIFKDNEALIKRYVENQDNTSIKGCVFYIDGMVNNKLLNEDIIKPFLEYTFKHVCRLKASSLIDAVAKRITLSNSVEKTADIDKIIQAIVYGDTVMLIDNCKEALILNTKGWLVRAIAEPENEKVLRGPREGFNESIIANLAMIRRRLRTPDLKMKFKTFGVRSQTKGCICYLEGVVNKDVLAELEKRLSTFSIDGVLDVNYINEFIRDARHSPIKTIGSTERPDVAAAKLLEGRVALFLDGTPVVLTIPYLFIENFQSNDDYYLNYYFGTIGRILRVFALFLTTSVPAIYIALTCFHQEMLPTPLIVSITMARQGVPLPTVLEAFVMLIVFEILRETGSRVPSSIGQSLSIVGALVIGQAAVDAKLVSSPMIVIIATAGITGLIIPRIKGGVIIARYTLLTVSSLLGLYGYILCMMGMLIYLFNISSFGIPIMTSAFNEGLKDKKDILIRFPWQSMKKRPKYIATDEIRSESNLNGNLK